MELRVVVETVPRAGLPGNDEKTLLSFPSRLSLNGSFTERHTLLKKTGWGCGKILAN
jgi:hypothetical protein